VYDAVGFCILGAKTARVDEMKGTVADSGVLYDLIGCRLNSKNKGQPYIHNGKKYLNVK
jgi:hypothetical protein